MPSVKVEYAGRAEGGSVTINTVAVQVPETLYRRLERLATLTNRPLENLLSRP
jgi:hypothetical protein